MKSGRVLNGLWEAKILLASRVHFFREITHENIFLWGIKLFIMGVSSLVLYYFNILGHGELAGHYVSSGHFRRGFLGG